MALVLADRVRDTTTTTGTGTVTLSGTAPTGYQNFSVVGNGNTTYYTINAGSQWEVGIGTYSSTGPTLSRDTVLSSSSSGSLVDFAAGTKDVFLTYPSGKSVYQDGSAIKAGSAVLGVPNGGTGATTLSSGYLLKGNGTSAVSASIVYDSGTQVGIGTTSPTSFVDIYAATGANLNVRGDGGVNISGIRSSTDATGPNAVLRKARGTSASPTAVTTGDNMGTLVFSAFGGTNNRNIATIASNVELYVSDSIISSNLTFSTTSLSTTPTECMRITSTGAVGIGTASPGFKLETIGGIAATTGSNQVVLTTDGSIEITRSTGDAYIDLKNTTGEDFDCRIQSLGTTTPALAFSVNGSERMRITDTGNVGIGTTGPGALLQLNKASGAADLRFSVAGTLYGNMYASSSDMDIFAVTAIPLILGTNNTERMRITSAGDVGIGTSSPASLLHVKRGSNATENYPTGTWATRVINATDATAENGLLVGNRWAADASTVFEAGSLFGGGSAWASYYKVTGIGTHIWGGGGTGTEYMRLTSSGNVGIGTSPVARLDVLAGSNQRLLFTERGTGGSVIDSVNAVNNAYQLLVLNSSVTAFQTSATERMRITAAGFIGIGTSSPQTILHLSTTDQSTNRLRLQNTGTSGGNFDIVGGNPGASNIGLAIYDVTNAATRMYIDTSGNVGIGTTSPQSKMEIRATSGGSVFNALTLSNYVGASAGTGVALHFDPNGAGTLARAASIQSVQSTSGNYADLRFFTANSDTPAERMRIGVNGGVAIGGTGTDATLHIQSSYGGYDRLTQMAPSAASKDAFNIMAAKNASSVDLWWSWGVDTSNRWRINQGVGFSTNGMAITDTGNVGMGTLSPSGKLHVETTGTGDVIYIAANTGGTAGQSVYVIPVRTAGTLRGGIQWNGTNLLYNNSSDSRLKENVADADDAASLIDAIQVRKFNWKESGSHQRYGFIAQELVAVAPEAVHQPEDEDEMMGVDYSKLVPILIKEVQSLRARVAQLEGN